MISLLLSLLTIPVYPEAIAQRITEKPPIVANNPYILLTGDELVNQKEVWVTAVKEAIEYLESVGKIKNGKVIV